MINGTVYVIEDGKPVKELPIDMYNHGMDTMRYAVMGLDNTPWLLW